MINIVDSLTFDDLLLIPKYSTIKTRKDVDLSVRLSKGLSFKQPLIPANMKSICGERMAKTIADGYGLAILHRFMTVGEQINIVSSFVGISKLDKTIDYMKHVGVSVGVKEEDYKNVEYLYSAGARIFCIDVAHGDSEMCVKMTEYISNKYPDVFLISGNVATADGARRLWGAGADCCKVNVGAGSVCTTRTMTGNGVPQMTALSNVYDMREKLSQKLGKALFIIADGGCKNSGDIVKSLCFSDLVMSGNLFAGTDETSSEKLEIDGKQFNTYVGSSTHKTSNIEGVAALVPSKGKVNDVIEKLCDGIKSGLSYQGCRNLTELKKDPRFVHITNAGLIESHPHDVIVR